jgi:hypothetical protein
VTTVRAQLEKAAQNGSPTSPYSELGAAGKQGRWSSFNDDFLHQLRGRNAIKTYREMSDNDDTVGEILFAIEMLIRQVDWNVEPGGETSKDTEAAGFLEECRDDMSHSFADFISTVLTYLSYGWAFHEVVYKTRDGSSSKYDDQKVGWRKFAYQPQETWNEWITDEHGGVQAFVWSTGTERGSVPIDKGLLFRTTTARGPNGRSVLRNAYRPWFYKKRSEELLMIGIDRDLNGLPIAEIPAESVLAQDSTYTQYTDMVTRIRRDEQMGAVLPLEYDEAGNPLYKFSLLTSNASTSIEATKNVIGMLAGAISGVVLADFIRLGRDAVGSRALAEPKQQLFQKALQGWVTGIAEVLNRHAVPKLFALNDLALDALPQFVPSVIEDVALEDLGNFIQKTGQAGMDWGFLNPEDPITDQVRQLAGFDAAPETDLTKLRYDQKEGS